MAEADAATPAQILTFWRDAGHDRWYTQDEAFDTEIRRRYLDLWRKAANGELSSWETTTPEEQAFLDAGGFSG
jgi:uncharacterized protein (DUF924 family)